ncbi:hypothetical protein SNK05_003382 [Fusarium graminearum]
MWLELVAPKYLSLPDVTRSQRIHSAMQSGLSNLVQGNLRYRASLLGYLQHSASIPARPGYLQAAQVCVQRKLPLYYYFFLSRLILLLFPPPPPSTLLFFPPSKVISFSLF